MSPVYSKSSTGSSTELTKHLFASPSSMWDKLGPRAGDAKSLWNSAPSPGWTKQEVYLLKLCLMKYGVGRWAKIMASGLLPGKVIHQLNGQTQRLLGQQSLAGYTGLRIDIDRVRADNESRVDVIRKSGLIIYSGAPPTKQMKAIWRKSANEKYALSKDDLIEVEKNIQAVLSENRQTVNETVQEDTLDEHIQVLIGLRRRLLSLVEQISEIQGEKIDNCTEVNLLVTQEEPIPSTENHQSDDVARSKADDELKHPRAFMKSELVSDKAEDYSPLELTMDNSHKATKIRCELDQAQECGAIEGAHCHSTVKRKTACVDPVPKRSKRSRKKSRKAFNSVEDAIPEAADAEQCNTIMAMGYSRKHAEEALEESNHNLNEAVEWLLAHCF